MQDHGKKKTGKASKASPQYFVALDGFRGVLAIMIAIYHTQWLSHINETPLFQHGAPLVDLFFVFSGFLMFTLYNGRINSVAQGKEFVKRRFARIYPLHFFMLFVALAYSLARVGAHFVGAATYEMGEVLPFQMGANETVWSFLSNLTLLHSMGIHDTLTYNIPSWTVSVEFYTYFVFAAMMLWARPKKTWHFGLIALLVAVNYYALSRVKPDMDFHYDLGFWRCLGGFFTGVVASYMFGRLKPAYEKLRQNARPRLFTLWASVFELVVFSTLFGFIIYFPGKLQFFIAPVALIFVLGFSYDMGLISRFLKRNIFRYLAQISYSIYMVHIVIAMMFTIVAENIFPIVLGADWNASFVGGDLLLLPYLACVLLFSHFTFKYVELPGRKALIAYDFGGKWNALTARLKTDKV